MSAGMRSARPWVWASLAVMLGLISATFPPAVAGGLVILVALGLAVLVEPALGIMLMLSLAPLKTLIATESPIRLPVDIGQLCFAGAIGAWTLNRILRDRNKPLPHTVIYRPLVVILLVFSPSIFNAISLGAWISDYLKWIEMLILVIIVLDLGPRWTWIAFGAVLAATLQAILGLYEFFGGSGAPHLWIANYRYFRAFGTFGQPNPFSAFMGLTLPLSLGLAWGYLLKSFQAWRARRSQWIRPGIVGFFYAGCGGLLFGGLVASWGRGAWMGFGAAAIVMVFFAPRRWWQGAVLLITGGVVVLLLWMLGYVPLSVQQRVNTTLTEFTGFGDMRAMPINNDNFAIVERLAHWQAATYMANAHPWIGVGLGNYEAVYPAYRIPSWPHPLGHAHNDYLNTLAETGIIGLMGYLFSWAAIVYWTWRALQQPDLILRGLVLGLLGTWTHLAIHSLVDKLYVNNLFLHVGVLLGLLALAHIQQQVRE